MERLYSFALLKLAARSDSRLISSLTCRLHHLIRFDFVEVASHQPSDITALSLCQTVQNVAETPPGQLLENFLLITHRNDVPDTRAFVMVDSQVG